MTAAPAPAPAAPAPADPADRTGRGPQSGPPLLAPVLALTGLTIAYVILNRATPHPDASGLEVLRYAAEHRTTAELGALLLLGAAVPMALIAAVLYRRLRALGITAPGSAITLVGGVLAAAALMLSAMSGWAGARLAESAGPDLARALADLAFFAGGPAYSAMFALLLAGVAVPGLLAGLLPRPLAWAGLILGAVGMLALLGLVVDGFQYLLPVLRFGGLAWLVWAAVKLPRTRHGLGRAGAR
ncbi:DUF4386 domain-containing protein [Streptomyces sp. NPDC059917]|uniref:DUF4386 domain-containing protein n=1 Tax=Streptomyces sp. NPDC059917 TaxID=3347002 RepID=UPI0036695ABC